MTFVGGFGNCAEVLALAERAEAAAATAGFISESAGFAFRHPARTTLLLLPNPSVKESSHLFHRMKYSTASANRIERRGAGRKPPGPNGFG